MIVVALYSVPAGEMVCMFEGQQGGVTQVKFSPDGTKLYSGGRKASHKIIELAEFRYLFNMN